MTLSADERARQAVIDAADAWERDPGTRYEPNWTASTRLAEAVRAARSHTVPDDRLVVLLRRIPEGWPCHGCRAHRDDHDPDCWFMERERLLADWAAR